MLQRSGDSVVIGTKQIKCQPFKRWLGSRGSGPANSFGKQSAAILFSPPVTVLAVFASITLNDILKNFKVIAPRLKVTLQEETHVKSVQRASSLWLGWYKIVRLLFSRVIQKIKKIMQNKHL